MSVHSIHDELLVAARAIGAVHEQAQWASLALAELMARRYPSRPVTDLRVGELLDLIDTCRRVLAHAPTSPIERTRSA